MLKPDNIDLTANPLCGFWEL